MDAGINGDAQRIEQMVWMLFLKVYDAKEDDWELNEDNYESIIPEDLRWRNWAKADSNGHAMTGDKLLNFVNNTLFPVLKGNDVKEGDTIVYEGIKVTPDTPIKKAIVKSTFEDANNYMKDGVYLRQVIDVIDEIEFDDVKESHAFGFVYEEILRELQSAGSSGEFYTPRAVTEFMALMIKPKLGEKMADFACGTGGFITSWLGQLSKQVTDTSAQKQLDDSIYGIEKKPFPYLLCVTNMLLHDIEIPKIYHMNSLKHNLLDYTDADKFDVTLQFERALADYTRCEQTDGVSVESRYRVGMAHYLMRKYDDAIRTFTDSLAIAPQDDDMYIADVYWLVLSQLRAEKADEAQKTLKQHYRPDMYVGHHTAYEKAMRVAAGFAPMEDMLAELDAEEDDLQFAMTAYGLCVLLEAHGETEKADALRQKLLKRDGFWFCFSYLAAYSDYKYTVKPATVK